MRIKPELALPNVKNPREPTKAKRRTEMPKLVPTTVLYLLIVLFLSSLYNLGALKSYQKAQTCVAKGVNETSKKNEIENPINLLTCHIRRT